ncbi:MAG: 4-(cytidine 5'-diphospho)-2-C-methyl-D-erythritol kinase [Pseudomonadota bacterium]
MPDSSEATVVEQAPAKLNLDLYVERRRADGYHDLDSIVVFTDLADTLAVEPAEGFVLHLAGPFADALEAAGESLVRRAAAGFAALLGRTPDVAITLTKRLPLAAGLGGGSADAAATIRALRRLWGAAPEPEQLAAFTRSLGADVPVCLVGRPTRMQGIGDRLAEAPFCPRLDLVLVNPRRAAPTGPVYAALEPDDFAPPPEPRVVDGDWPRWLVEGRNALERAAIRVQPAIGEVSAALRATDARVVRLCGSGATVFAAFDTAAAADLVARHLATRHPGWWVQRTATRS